MSKFEKYKKTDEWIYPHKHCEKCNKMISEERDYCEKCFRIIEQEKKEKMMKESVFRRIKNKFKKQNNKK